MACLLPLLIGTVAASPTVRITEPAPWSVVHGDGPDERQYRDVRVTLRYDGLTTTDHALWLRLDGEAPQVHGPPLPSSGFTMQTRLGTHSVEVAHRAVW